jgi:hypothetical protein
VPVANALNVIVFAPAIIFLVAGVEAHAPEKVIVPASSDVKLKCAKAVEVLVMLNNDNVGGVVSHHGFHPQPILHVCWSLIELLPQKHQSGSEHVCPSLTVVFILSRPHRSPILRLCPLQVHPLGSRHALSTDTGVGPGWRQVALNEIVKGVGALQVHHHA